MTRRGSAPDPTRAERDGEEWPPNAPKSPSRASASSALSAALSSSRSALAVALSAAVLVASASAADRRPSSELARAIDEFARHVRSYETTDDPAALAAEVSLLERLEAAGEPLSDSERIDRELVRARLERAIRTSFEKIAGRPSKLRTGPPPEPRSAAEERLAHRIDLLARNVDDLLPAEVAAAHSDTTSERHRSQGGPVARSLDALARALDTVAPAAKASVRDYLRVLRAQTGYRGSVAELVALAEAESRACEERMEAIAEGCGAPSWDELVERLKEQGAREDPIRVAREEAARSTSFARGIFTVPDDVVSSLAIDEGDPRSRTPFGHYLPIGWKGNVGHYVVTAMSGSDAGAVSRRRESFRYMIRGVAAHEGIPGHHLHFATAARSNDPLRRLGFEGATTEGWGLFIEGVLERARYFDEPREARLTPFRMRRWRALRVILDAGLQTGTISREQAIERLQRDVGFDRPTATDEVDRYRERAGYYSGYLLGARTFEEIERRAFARGGAEAARRARDRILALGPAAPLVAVRRLLR